jgi:hypothetical protein
MSQKVPRLLTADQRRGALLHMLMSHVLVVRPERPAGGALWQSHHGEEARKPWPLARVRFFAQTAWMAQLITTT